MKVETYLKNTPTTVDDINSWVGSKNDDYEALHSEFEKEVQHYSWQNGQRVPANKSRYTIEAIDHMPLDKLLAKVVRDLYSKFSDHPIVVDRIEIPKDELNQDRRTSGYKSYSMRLYVALRCEACDEPVNTRRWSNKQDYSVLDVNTKSGKIDRSDQWGLNQHRTNAESTVREDANERPLKPFYVGYISQSRVTKKFWAYPPKMSPPINESDSRYYTPRNSWTIWMERSSTSTGEHIEWKFFSSFGMMYNTPELAYAAATVLFGNHASETQEEWNFAYPAVNATMVASVSWEQALSEFIQSVQNTPMSETVRTLERIQDFKRKMAILDVAEESLRERLTV